MSASEIRYVDFIGDFPNLRCDIVTPPDFLESYAKYPCAYMSVSSPMILMADLLAPTVPSDPNPQNLHWIVPSGSVWIGVSTGSERFVTSSTIPIVNPSLGWSRSEEHTSELQSRPHLVC